MRPIKRIYTVTDGEYQNLFYASFSPGKAAHYQQTHYYMFIPLGKKEWRPK